MENKKYLLGLDIGTNSVGWCLTDQNYNIIKKQGKSLWGVRLFEDASSSKDRRVYRSNRRRLERRKYRINLLKDFFAEEVNKIDPNFFIRLKESRLVKEDKSTEDSYLLFNDLNFSDKDFYKKYPTIWHLIKDIIENENRKFDIRLVYLACAYLIKYRGHFLIEGDLNIHDYTQAYKSLENINEILSEHFGDDCLKLNIGNDTIEKVLMSYREVKGKLNLSKELGKILIKENSINSKTSLDYLILNMVIKLISGSQLNIEKILNCSEKISFSLIKDDFEESLLELMSKNPEKEYVFDIIKECKKIYDFIILSCLLENKTYLYEVMIERYNKHYKDLNDLKDYIKHNCPNKKNLMFGRPVEGSNSNNSKEVFNYSAYVGFYERNKKTYQVEKTSRDNFYSFIKKFLGIDGKNLKEEDISDLFKRKVFGDIKNLTYMPKLNDKSNGIFPVQLNKLMLEKILNNQSKYYDFLNKSDGVLTKDKILSLLTFKIPYFVGPLYTGKNRGENSWIIKNKNEKVYPWNFKEIVNEEATAQQFISRMTNKCTFLFVEDCLPKYSILYTEFLVLSELNKILVNGKYIEKDKKDQLIKEVYLKNKNVTLNKIKTWFIKTSNCKDVEITTTNNKAPENFTSFVSLYDFTNILGSDFVNQNRELIEKIIFYITVFEDKTILKKTLNREFKNIISEKNIERISLLNYSGWGRFSKKFLSSFYGCDKNGEIIEKSIIKIMREKNLNLQEIIYSDEYNFIDSLKAYQAKHGVVKSYNIESIKEDIDESYTSPLMKRALIQTFEIILELEKIINQKIDEFYIECAREKLDTNKVPDSRYKAAQKIIEEAAKSNYFSSESNEIKELLNEFKTYENNKNAFRSDKIYLYFTQLGRCLYSGKKISFNDVISANNVLDIDHIYPRSKIKDDSLINNKVLVYKDENARKGDEYPYFYPNRINNYDPYKYFKFLRDINSISEEKYKRLTRKEELSNSEMETFINRQLVTTNQSNKAVKDILSKYHGENTEIVFSKATYVSSYRQLLDLVKCREANDYHHAHDAFLNIVVGRTIYYWFNKGNNIQSWYLRLKRENKTTNPEKIFENEKNTKPNFYDTKGNLIYDYKDTVKKVKDTIYKRFDVMVTVRPYKCNDIFSKDGITPKSEVNKDALPLKKGLDIYKYGGYSSLRYSNYCLVSSLDKKGNKVLSIEPIRAIYKNEPLSYLKEQVGLKNPEIMIDNLKVNTVLQKDKTKFCLASVTGDSFNLKNLVEPNYNECDIKLIKLNEKAYNKLKESGIYNLKEDSLELDNYKETFVISPAKNEKNKEIVIKKEDCISLLKTYLNKLCSDLYSTYSSYKNLIASKLHDFINSDDLSNYELYKLVLLNHEINKLFKANTRESSDLRYLGLSKNSGVLTMNKKLNKGSTKLLFESVTGFYKKVWDLE